MKLYADEDKFDDTVKEKFAEDRIELHPYAAVQERMREFRQGETILLDPEQMNYALYRSIPEQVKKIERENPVIRMKAVKNETEIANIREAHLKMPDRTSQNLCTG